MSERPQMLVYANDVEIGRIGSEEYAQLKRDARKTPSIYLMQAVNLVYVMAILFEEVLRVTPILIFWVAIWVIVDDPADARQFAVAIHARFLQHQSLFSANAIQTMLLLLICFFVISLTMDVVVQGRLRGFVNVFDDEIQRRIKISLKQPVYGRLFVVEDSVGEAIKKLDGEGGVGNDRTEHQQSERATSSRTRSARK